MASATARMQRRIWRHKCFTKLINLLKGGSSPRHPPCQSVGSCVFFKVIIDCNFSRCCEAPGVFFRQTKKQHTMKQIFDFISSNRELIESAIGLFCVYGMIGLVWFVIKYFS